MLIISELLQAAGFTSEDELHNRIEEMKQSIDKCNEVLDELIHDLSEKNKRFAEFK